MKNALPELEYWHAEQGPDTEIWSPKQDNRYLTFETDCAGLNNIRMAFECVVSLAAFTGRTLVLPPAEPWFLTDFDFDNEWTFFNRSHMGDVFDIGAVSEFVPVITCGEFQAAIADQYRLPRDLIELGNDRAPIKASDFNPGQPLPWYEWLRANAVVPQWNPVSTLLCYPDIIRVKNSGFSASSPFADGRALVENDQKLKTSQIIHFPATHQAGYRSFGQAVNMVVFAYPELARLHRRLIKRAVRYRPQVFSFASRVIEELGLRRYSALHIRRNDFAAQFGAAVSESPERIRSYLDSTVPKDEPLYIATDEPNAEYLRPLVSGRQVFTWNNLLKDKSGKFRFLEDVPDVLVGPVEQIICSASRLFIGTKYSTFSMYIHRLRCFTGAPDLEVRYHTVDSNEPQSIESACQRRGRDWSTEYTGLWTRC